MTSFGGIHKSCGHGRGRGVSQMSMLLHKPNLVKWSTKRGRGSKMSKEMLTWFITLIIAFRDVTAKFYWMGLKTIMIFSSQYYD